MTYNLFKLVLKKINLGILILIPLGLFFREHWNSKLLIVFFCISIFLYSKELQKNFLFLIKQFWYRLLLLLLAFCLISLSYSENPIYGLNRISFVFLIIVFPVFLMSLKREKIISKRTLFIMSSLALTHASIIVLKLGYYYFKGLSLLDIYKEYGYLKFEYIFGFSGINGMYYSMILIFCYYIVINSLKERIRDYNVFFVLTITIISSLTVFFILLLTDVKIAYATITMVLIYSLYSLRLNRLIKILILVLMTLSVVYKTVISPSPRINRFIEIGDPTRINNYKSSLEVILNNPIIGVGLGDELSEIQKVRFDSFIVKNKYNAHNQFIEITLGLGLVGLVLFVWFLCLCFSIAIKNKDHSFIIFLLLISCYFMIESILVRHYGVLFVCFFLSFFLVLNQIDPNQIKHK
ncbi:O-antigen ligase family protein [Flavivirga spongiicola]|uniref:O-antigen ligase family protein n=1 Tax=Flavivirga spongiicola TaxID=421621 RepID=A0ABU7XV87_9FLAO|nr:O-antigen ligase family protein [Flavivirga sp. MEBiC05379]MDO5978840.1 O-antigen ligase family protein [Flavivirga sp. MEBiC05379]